MSRSSMDNDVCRFQSLDVLSDEEYGFDNGRNVLDFERMEEMEMEMELQLRRLLIRRRKIPLLLVPGVDGTDGRKSIMLPLLLVQPTAFSSGHVERCRIGEEDPGVRSHPHEFPKVGQRHNAKLLARGLVEGKETNRVQARRD